MYTLYDIESLLDTHPTLNMCGYQQEGNRSLSACRSLLLHDDSLGAINAISEWLNIHLWPVKTINYRHSAYGLKHILERDIGYIFTGEFIAAAMLVGYRIGKPTIHPSFNMSEASIRRADKTTVRSIDMRMAPTRAGKSREVLMQEQETYGKPLHMLRFFDALGE